MEQTIIQPQAKLNALSQVLNRQIANFNVLYVKLHHFHWYVKGPHFYQLHEKFEELYNEVAQHSDEVAERLLTIGGQPLSTMKAYLEEAGIQEAAGGETAEQMVQTLHDDMSRMAEELKNGMEEAEKQGDESTADLLLGIRRSFEKHIWMLRSFMGQ